MPRTKVKDLRMHSALFIIHMCIVRTVVICRGACRVWLRPYELCIIWMRLHSYEWGFIHMNEASFIWMRHCLYEWGLIYMNEASFIWMRHHPYEWGIIHMNDMNDIQMKDASYAWGNIHITSVIHGTLIWVICMMPHSYEWGIIHMNEASCIWIIWMRHHECMTSVIHGTLTWVYDLNHTRHAHMSHVNDASFISMMNKAPFHRMSNRYTAWTVTNKRQFVHWFVIN